MLTNEEIKQILKRVLFPNFTNKLTWLITLSGISIISAPTPWGYACIVWAIKTFNINYGDKFTISDFYDAAPDTNTGFYLILIAVIHNITYRLICAYEKFSTDRTHQEKKKNEIACDIKTLSELKKDLTSKPAFISFLKEHNFGTTFNYSEVENLEVFLKKWEGNNYMFIDKPLENERKRLISALNKLYLIIINNIDSINTQGTRSTILPHHEKASGYYSKTTHDLIESANAASSECYESYQNIIKLGKLELAN
ncbi:hypothetical protein EYY94_07675 [Obesumbacterium proteus]|uniref:hypothetical protein n=1 Tax=Obesumbacterium proteus TaxID=82983 RepID=UPI001034EF78|nr:hypothetical protein [Obesumbacterium proteus]TBL75817.1 hypothetical protein EYY94_07675 [Obesumbacterium proteus]